MFDKRSDIIRFLTVADTGGIGLAADRLEMTQPALTRIIARLEREFDGRLFERLPKGVRLTSLGTTAAEVGRRILTEIEAAEEQLDATHSRRTASSASRPARFGTALCYRRSSPGFTSPFRAFNSRSKPPVARRACEGCPGVTATCIAAASTMANGYPTTSGVSTALT